MAATRWNAVKDLVGAMVFFVIGGVFLREMGDLPKAVAKYPSVIIYLIFGFCLILAVRAIASLVSGKAVQNAAAGEEQGKMGFPTALVLVLSFLYVLAMPYIGFVLSSAVMMIVFMLAVGIRSLPLLILVPLCEIAFLMYVFESLLAVFLPAADPLKAFLGLG